MIDLNNLEPGQTAIYYTGASLAKHSFSEVKHTAFQMYMRGEAELTQRRSGDGQFEYRVTRRHGKASTQEIQAREEYYYRKINKKEG